MIDSNLARFDQDVVQASLQTPVVVDFWAPWCAPCRTLGPMLEKLETEYAGRFKLVKIDSDQNPELSQAFQIRSIPFVVAFVGGQPVDQFMGVLPESQLRSFIDRLIPTPSQSEHARAQDLLAAGDADGGLAALRTALALDAANDDARLDLAMLLLDRDDAEGADAQLVQLSRVFLADPAVVPHVEALRTRIDALRQEVKLPPAPELEARLAAQPKDLDARLALANLYIAHQAWEAALEQLLLIVQTDRQFQNDIGRTSMIQVFDLAANQSQLVSRYRRLLSSAVLK